jgi:Fe-S-cluster containining protein
MKLETNLTKINTIAKKKDDENWRFRSYLKFYHGTEEEIDRVVHDLYQRISAEIDCKQCANCCQKLHPALDTQDMRILSLSLRQDITAFKEHYLVPDDEDPDKFGFNRLPCPFLLNNLCTQYEHRPQDCHSFPHLDKPEFASRLWGIIENYAICPIVFNVYEYLKIELWNKNQ